MIEDVEQDDEPAVPNFVVVNGRVDLEMSPVLDLISGNTRWTFLESTRFFLEETFLMKEPKVYNMTVEILSQTKSNQRLLRHRQEGNDGRYLQDTAVLYLALNITGTVEAGIPKYNFAHELTQTFTKESANYIQTLKATGDPYFDGILNVESPAQETLPPSPSPETAKPTVPVLPPETDDNFAGRPELDDDFREDVTDPGISLPIIVAIAVGGSALVMLTFVFWVRSSRKNSNDGADIMSFSSSPALSGVDDTPKRRSLFGNGKANVSTARTSNSSSNNPNNILELRSATSNDSLRAPASDAGDSQSMALYSYGRGDDNQSFMGETLQGLDSMSYAYSLEAGFEPSVVSGSGAYGDAAPIPTEIPQISRESEIDENQNGADTNSAIDTDDEYGLTDRDYQYDNETIEMSESDLQLTKSELAMLPSDLIGGSQSGSFGDIESGLSSKKDNFSSNGGTNATTAISASSKITRCCFAPPGKLGIIIDTTVEGPVVHKVNSGSPLEGLVWKGDIIVKIDDVDTRAMSATAITNLMIKTAHQRRKLTIVSDPNGI